MRRKFAERLEELRKEQQLSYVKLSKLTGMGQSSLYDWEKGNNDITSDNLIILADFFGVTTDYLLGRED